MFICNRTIKAAAAVAVILFLSTQSAGALHVQGAGVPKFGEPKVARLYGEWLHIAHIPKGQWEIAVTLTSNDNRPIAGNSQSLFASVVLIVSEEQAVGGSAHNHQLLTCHADFA